MKVHGNLLENFHIFEHDSDVSEDKLFRIFIVFVNEKLISFLLISYEIFSTDYGQVLLILAFVHSQHLVWFTSCFIL